MVWLSFQKGLINSLSDHLKNHLRPPYLEACLSFFLFFLGCFVGAIFGAIFQWVFGQVLMVHILYMSPPPKLTPAKQRAALNKLKVKVKTSAKYLGVYLTRKGSTSTDITQRIHRGRSGFEKLHKFWRHSNITKTWKLQVFNTVFVPMFTYSTESAFIEHTDMQKLDAFQEQCLHKILNEKSTCYTKVLDPSQPTLSNNQIMQLSQQIPISQSILAIQLKFLGHVLRGTTEDLETDICFTRTPWFTEEDCRGTVSGKVNLRSHGS